MRRYVDQSDRRGVTDEETLWSLNVGTKLRSLRQLRGVSLKEVGEATGISAAFLSLIERGLTDIALSRMVRLVEYYGISIGEFFDSVFPDDGRSIVIAPVEHARSLERGTDVTYRVIRESSPQVFYVELAPGASFSDLRAHAGEDFWLAIKGKVDVLYGERAYPLGAMDTAEFAARVPHGIANPYGQPAILVAVTSVPFA